MPGILWNDDFDRLKDSAFRVLERFAWSSVAVRFVEIGIHNCETSKSMMDCIYSWYEDKDLMPSFVYYGIDPFVDTDITNPDFIHVKKMSHVAETEIPSLIHWIFIDGCHCSLCVGRDMAIYGMKLASGAEICLHDASPGAQGRDPQTYEGMNGHHDIEIAADGISVRKAIENSWMKNRLKMVQAAPDADYGGVEVYRKI